MSKTLAHEDKFSSRFASVLSFRVLGVFPLIFFLLQAIHYWNINEVGHMLWMCNIGNLLLAVGLFLDKPMLTRVAILWTIPGLAIWIIFVVLPWGLFFTSILAHVGGLVVAMVALKRFGMDRRTWLYAWVWFLIIQAISRVFTATELNVNLSHRMQERFESTFHYYWLFLITLDVLTGLVLWGLGMVIARLKPPTVDREAS